MSIFVRGASARLVCIDLGKQSSPNCTYISQAPICKLLSALQIGEISTAEDEAPDWSIVLVGVGIFPDFVVLVRSIVS